MKKILLLLSIFGFSTVGTISVVSCGGTKQSTNTSSTNENQDLNLKNLINTTRKYKNKSYQNSFTKKDLLDYIETLDSSWYSQNIFVLYINSIYNTSFSTIITDESETESENTASTSDLTISYTSEENINNGNSSFSRLILTITPNKNSKYNGEVNLYIIEDLDYNTEKN